MGACGQIPLGNLDPYSLSPGRADRRRRGVPPVVGTGEEAGEVGEHIGAWAKSPGPVLDRLIALQSFTFALQ